VTKYTGDSSNFGADGPFFRIIREGPEGLADGGDYFDLLTDDAVFEYVIPVPGYPRRVEGRQNIIDLYSGYGDFMTVHRADHLRVYALAGLPRPDRRVRRRGLARSPSRAITTEFTRLMHTEGGPAGSGAESTAPDPALSRLARPT
jgi:hypothetical protein